MRKHLLTSLVWVGGIVTERIVPLEAWLAIMGLLAVVTFWLYRNKVAGLFRFRKRYVSQGDALISLADAVTKAWAIKKMRELPEFKTLARDRPQDVLRRLAERIFDGGDPSLSIRGVIGNPPLEQTVEAPEEYTFSDDLTEMTHITGDGRCYRELRVRWTDIETSIRQRTGLSLDREKGHEASE